MWVAAHISHHEVENIVLLNTLTDSLLRLLHGEYTKPFDTADSKWCSLYNSREPRNMLQN